MGISLINHPFWGTPIDGTPPYRNQAIASPEYPAGSHATPGAELQKVPAAFLVWGA